MVLLTVVLGTSLSTGIMFLEEQEQGHGIQQENLVDFKLVHRVEQHCIDECLRTWLQLFSTVEAGFVEQKPSACGVEAICGVYFHNTIKVCKWCLL